MITICHCDVMKLLSYCDDDASDDEDVNADKVDDNDNDNDDDNADKVDDNDGIL